MQQIKRKIGREGIHKKVREKERTRGIIKEKETKKEKLIN
jgi:hypothetical protein